MDSTVRRLVDGPLARLAAAADRPGVTPDRLTVAGLLVGLGSAVAAAAQLWWVALALWLLSRLADGLDGPLARRRKATTTTSDPVRTSEAGGFLDITADFIVYGSTVVGVAIGVTEAYGAPWWPFLLVLLTYYVNGTAFLAFSSAVERRRQRTGLEDERTFVFTRGLAEGTETIVAHALFVLLPAAMAGLAWAFAAVVAVTVLQRVVVAVRALA